MKPLPFALVHRQKFEWFSAVFENIKVLNVKVVWCICNVFFNLRIDDIEDEIYREKLKIKKVSDELSDTFDDMLDNY